MNYVAYYRDSPSVKVEEAYIRCINDIRLMEHSGIYGGKQYCQAQEDLRYLTKQLIDFHLDQCGYSLLDTGYGYRQYLLNIEE